MIKRLVIAVAVLIVLVYAGWIFNRLSDKPNFCKSCHFMKPYVENWETSGHNEVECKSCHWAPGFSNYIKGKVRLATEILRYWVGAYNPQVHSKVEDEACIQCHPLSSIEDTIIFMGKVHFSHPAHYGDTLRQIKMPCTGCHYELVQGNHLAVTTEPCFICHFTGRPMGKPVKDCNTCHGPPKGIVLLNGMSFDHQEYVHRNIPCITCHIKVTRGKGDVPRRSCYKCHVERFEAYEDVKRIHSIHISREKFRCTLCHTSLEHSNVEIAQAISPNCRTCHLTGHLTQEKMYMGSGGKGVPVSPDPMFLSNVACFGCHKGEADSSLSEWGTVFARASGKSCVGCHGDGFDRLMSIWNSSVGRKISNLKPLVSLYKNVSQRVGNEVYINIANEAEENLVFVERDRSFGVHNIRYTLSLLNRVSQDLMNLKSQILKKKIKDNDNFKVQQECSNCHPDAYLIQKEVNGKLFPHKPHVKRLRCEACHSTKKHGVTYRKDCNTCHHSGDRKCESCHKIQALVFSGKIGNSQSPDPMFEAEVSCTDCHVEDSYPTKPTKEKCLDCHEEGYQSMMEEWQKETRDKLIKAKEKESSWKSKLEGESGVNLLRDFIKYLKFSALLDSLERDGSVGVHNYSLFDEILSQ